MVEAPRSRHARECAMRLLDALKQLERIGRRAARGLSRHAADAVCNGGGDLKVGVEVGQARALSVICGVKAF